LTGGASNPAYTSPGYLLYDRDGTLMAQPFDARGLRLTGDPFMVVPEVVFDGGQSHTDFAASDTGILAYRTVASLKTHTVWVDRAGKQLGVVDASENAFNLGLSPDDQRLAVSRATSQRGQRDIWIYDLAHGANSRLTFDPGQETLPLWSPDGSRLVFSGNREGAFNLYQKVTSGSGTAEPLLRTNDSRLGTDWSRDGRYIAYDVEDPRTGQDLWVLPLSGDRTPVPFLQTEAMESRGHFSPDGRWLTYTSNETGRYEVYVQAFPATGAKWQVSTGGGVEPRWRKDGQELCYVSLDRKMMAVDVKSGSTLEFGPPRLLFAARGLDVFAYRNPYAMTSDGQRFFMNVRVPDATTSPIMVLVNWPPDYRK
jgi:Tol biopolymer transport system component